MTINFLYIDDENPETSEGLIKNLTHDNFSIKIEQPKTWNTQKNHLIEKKYLENFDGLLLDLKLEFSGGENNDVRFSGADLAQTIRSDVKAGKIKDLPIFLCSTDNNFMSYFDRTSNDLFDKKYDKNNDLDKESTVREFMSFSNAYKIISKNNSVENLMKKSIQENEELLALQLEVKDFKTAHEYVYLINRYVIQNSGILIDEDLLAIRLGIDHRNSPDWEIVKSKLPKNANYYGILCECYERWWQSNIIEWWKEVFGKSIKVMSANEKVKAISEKFDLTEIVSLSLPEHHRFNTFWYKCRLSNLPLDPSDALRTIEMPRYVWQEPNYISNSYIKSDERDREKIISLLGPNEIKLFELL